MPRSTCARTSRSSRGPTADSSSCPSTPIDGRAYSAGLSSPPTNALPLLALLARHYRLENATLTTRGESPAGAGIAGSSALTIAVCGALARFTNASSAPDDLLQVAMNVECQTIKVPTGVQDYRPALYGGVAAIELGVGGIRRVGLDVDPRELERRIVLAYTGAPRNSGTNNWEITKRHIDGDREIFDCFERIRDAVARMRARVDRRRLGRGRSADRQRVDDAEATGTWRDDAGDRGADRRVRWARAPPPRRCAAPAVAVASSATGLRPPVRPSRRRSPRAVRACSTIGSTSRV